MFRHDMITQGLLYHDFPDDQDNGRKSLVVPSVIRNPFTAEVSLRGDAIALRMMPLVDGLFRHVLTLVFKFQGWCKWAILGACGLFRQMLDAKGGDALVLAQYVNYPIEEVDDEIWEQMEDRLHELQGVSTALQTG
ncbi:hypothetical protein HII31_13225 [Pseudocercospora fuligena]|uniref:Uncharacterized protein n=1 Tax=Pseudocercospora fuligena TaxID=685502 RepID=A0A8H6R7X5_9PEZI|nr:hypothetical protein HII31_13225 [Pseudocercospora fuligena]